MRRLAGLALVAATALTAARDALDKLGRKAY